MWSPSPKFIFALPIVQLINGQRMHGGMSIVIDAYAYLVELHILSNEALKSYSDKWEGCFRTAVFLTLTP